MTDGYKIKKIYVGTEQVRPSLWKPWANTLLYLPLENDINDATWNHTMTLTTTSYGTVAKDSSWYYYFNGGYISSESYTWPTQATLCCWVKRDTKVENHWEFWLSTHLRNWSPYHYLAFCFGKYSWTNWAYCIATWSWTWHETQTPQATIGTWEHWCVTYDSTNWGILYKNWTQVSTLAASWNLATYNWPTCVGWPNISSFYGQYFQWYLSKVIYESKSWTADEVADYFEWTKSEYLS